MVESARIIKKVSELRQESPAADFSGFGLVIYRGSIDDFPITPLLSNSAPHSPIKDTRELADYLVSISRYSDVRHDGFHFAHVSLGLTHIAQFFSPPIPKAYHPEKFGVGARYRSAELGSLVKNIISIAIFGKDGNVVVFENGMEVPQ
jgi:hypothetical protein